VERVRRQSRARTLFCFWGAIGRKTGAHFC
jgi:hypothetical protein